MTPTTPPAIPSDIPRETWNLAARIWAEMRTVEVNSRAEWCEGDVEAIAREILAAQERGKLMEREKLTDPAFLQTCLTNVGLVGKEAVAEAVLAERERGDARVEAGRQFVKRHPALTLLDLAEFEAFVGYLDALERVEAATAEGN